MQIIKTEGKYRVYGENIEVYDKLEPDFYHFMQDDGGPFIVRTSKPEVIGKVYGNVMDRVEKCFKTYEKFERSLGVMLVGDKGNGKTLFAKELCMKMIEAGYPVINVTGYYSSLPMFMTQLSQECVFLFDEFEKMFEHDEQRGSAQNEMLSTFDGINMTKKMFIITCNDISRLSQYIYNRPGRFHYSLDFHEPSYNEIESYLGDNIDTGKCIEGIKDVALFSYINGLNYDCLRSLVFELNDGYSLVESFDDLNIGYAENKNGSVSVVYDNGYKLEGYFNFKAFSNESVSCDLYYNHSWYSVGALRFKIKDVKYDYARDLYLDSGMFKIEFDNVSATDNKEKKEVLIHLRELTPKYVSVKIHRGNKNNPLRKEDISRNDAFVYFKRSDRKTSEDGEIGFGRALSSSGC